MAVLIDNRPTTAPLVDGYGRHVRYLRLSVTDRCDLRCVYCMPERMRFLPKADLLSFEEIERLADAFIDRGVTKLRLTGGEPLVRKGVIDLVRRLGARLGRGLNELALTTNGVLLEAFANDLAGAGVSRVNISLDTLNPDTFARIARRQSFSEVMRGVDAAERAGLRVKINTVALADANRDEIPAIIQWAHERGFDISLIEVMPMGEGVAGRRQSFLSLQDVRTDLEKLWTLTETRKTTGGPSRYVRVQETGGLLGFISPLTNNFCDGCNRIRLTATGRLYSCLGHEEGADLRAMLRRGVTSAGFDETLDAVLGAKPARHDFDQMTIDRAASPRTMSVTGG